MAKESSENPVEIIDANPSTVVADDTPTPKAKAACGCLEGTLSADGLITVEKVNDKCPHPLETFTVPQAAAKDIELLMRALRS